mmetsp:Transcript_39748/g.105005  ORF Transcript_39748/g.105005 Transcript_39748/m.105005 type:complete len:176 (-) Transcript_39748:333-860(-)
MNAAAARRKASPKRDGGSRPPALPTAAGSRKSTPGSSPASSGDRTMKADGKAYQKPKPSKSSSSSALRGDPDALAAKSSKGGSSTAPAEADEPFVPEEEEEGSITQGDGLMMAKARRQKSFEPPAPVETAEEEEFVPEEEEEGTFTQGDGLMMAKAKRNSPLKGLSPGGALGGLH